MFNNHPIATKPPSAGTSGAAVALLLLAFLSASGASASTCTWQGGAGSWSTTSNWTCGKVPVSNDSVIFSGTSTGVPTSIPTTLPASGNYTAFSINSGYTGNLNISSSALNTAAFTQGAGTFTSSGTVTVAGNFSYTAGTFTSTGNLNVSGNFTNSGGSFSHSTGTITLNGTSSATVSGLSTTGNLTINKTGSSYTVTLSNSATVSGTLTLTDGAISGSTITVQGNVSVGNAFSGGTALLTFTGGNAQTLTSGSGVEPSGTWTINKTAGTELSLGSTVGLGASQAVTIQSGDFVQGCGYNFTAGLLTLSGGNFLNCDSTSAGGTGTLSLAGITVNSVNSTFDYVGTGTITLTGSVSNGGVVRINGGGRTDGTPDCNGTKVTITATSPAKTWTGSGKYLIADVNVVYQAASPSITVYGGLTVGTGSSGWTSAGTACPVGDANPTLITLNSLTAIPLDGGVLLQWKSGREVSNLGYHIYRDGVRVTSSLVAGSALLAGPHTVLPAGGSYSWFDPDGTASSSYTLEDLDIHGARTTHEAVHAPSRTVPARLASLAAARRVTSPLLGQIGRAAVSAPSLAQGATSAIRESIGAAMEANLAGAAAVKLGVTGEGWYRVDASQLVAAGMPANVDPNRLQLFAEGRAQAITVSGTGKVSAIEFYGTGLDSAFTATRVYWLTWNGAMGARAQTSGATGSGAAPASFQATLQWQPRTVYFAALLNGDADNYFGPVLDAGDPVTQNLPVTHFAGGAGSSTLTVKMQGGADGAHAALVSLNGTDLGTMSFQDMASGSAAFTVLNSLLKEGDNALKLVTNGADDVSAVDTVTLTYPHSYTADGDYLRFTAQAGAAVTVGGFSGKAIEVVDITDPTNPILTPGTVAAQGSSYAVTFGASGSGVRTLLALTQAMEAAPASIVANQPSSWKGKQAGADMVIIGHAAFLGSLDPLLKLRQQAHKVAVVDVEDLYDEFNFGEQTPYAIKDFLNNANSTWVHRPRWVLLVGDGNFDPKNYLRTGRVDWVPVQLVETSLLETASDDWYADFNNDGVPQMAVGRLPVNSPADAATLVNRIVAYENANKAAWKQKALLVAGADDSDDPFSKYMTAAQALLPASMTVKTVPAGTDANAAADMLAAIDAGVGLVNYAGHGSQDEWAGGLMDSDAAGALTNGAATPLVVAMTCLNGYFQDPSMGSLAEAWLLAPKGGAVAVWASSGLTNSGPQAVMNQAMLQALYGGAGTIGEAAMAAKQSVSDTDVRRTWILFGDPAMNLR